MKKLVLAMIAILVVMLPRMTDAQEPTDNGTLPPHTVWLPAVRVEGCPWTVEYMKVIGVVSDFGGVQQAFVIGNPNLPIEEDIWEPKILGELVVFRDAEFSEIVMNTWMGLNPTSDVISGTERMTVIPSTLNSGTYYWKARFTCEGMPGAWSHIESFEWGE